LVVTNNHGPARLLLNQVGQERPWLGVRAVERGRDAYGARVRLAGDGWSLIRVVGTDGSYASAGDPRVLFGLGDRGVEALRLDVTWPGGAVERFPVPSARRYLTVRRGEGSVVPPATTDPMDAPSPSPPGASGSAGRPR
ncbi:MAG: ASPIC/UnbV domain-containing protein, partial [Acidobacteriota bacterium]